MRTLCGNFAKIFNVLNLYRSALDSTLIRIEYLESRLSDDDYSELDKLLPVRLKERNEEAKELELVFDGISDVEIGD